MPETIEDLYRQMTAAADRADFEEAARLRDRISLTRATGKVVSDADFPLAGLTRQRPGAMGLGTSQQRLTPPADWKPPRKPDPMTTGAAKPRGRRA